MGLLDDVQSTINRGVAATGRTARVVKLKSQMTDSLKRRQNLAAQLGASLYDATKDNDEFRAGREGLYDGIAAIDAEREQLQAEIDMLERQAAEEAQAAQSLVCPFCGTRVGAAALFCSGCGTPMAELQAALALDINAATDAEVQAMIDALNAAYAGLTKNPSEPGGPTDPTSPDGNTGSGNAGGGNAGSGNGAVQTGDAAAPAGLLAVLVISGGVVTVLARRKRMR